MVYEHRDEGPVREFIFRGKKRFAYRRCYAGIISNGLPFIKEIPSTYRKREEEKPSKSQDYKKIFDEHIHEISEIAYDISPEDAKRILKNLWRYLEQKRMELREQ